MKKRVAQSRSRVNRAERGHAKAKVTEAQSPAHVDVTAETDVIAPLVSLFGEGTADFSSFAVDPTQLELVPSLPSDVVPQTGRARCRCWNRRLETNERMNPYIYGHDHRCPLYLPQCEQCGHLHGTHRWDCSWWDANPTQQPF